MFVWLAGWQTLFLYLNIIVIHNDQCYKHTIVNEND